MPWAGGVYTRGYPSWSNDAANNLPISATKFDTEDNDFASGLNNCLTKDGLNVPTATLAWGLTNLPVAAFTRGSDGTVFSVARTGGANNPALALQVADASGATINLNNAAQTLSLAVNAVAILNVLAGGATLATGVLTLPNGTAAAPSAVFAHQATDGLYSVAAGELGVAIAGVQALDLQAHQLAVTGAAAASATLSIAGNGASIANGFQIVYGAAGGVTFNYAGAAVGTISAGGAWNIPAQVSGSYALTVNGLANQYTMLVQSSTTAGQGFGLRIQAGTNATDAAVNVRNAANSASFFAIDGTGQTTLLDGAGNIQPAGTRNVPLNGQNVNYTAVKADAGRCLYATAGTPQYTIPANVFSAGDVITVYNSISTGGQGVTIVQGASLTMYWQPSGSGANALTGNRTLAGVGFCTIFFVSGTQCSIGGNGLA